MNDEKETKTRHPLKKRSTLLMLIALMIAAAAALLFLLDYNYGLTLRGDKHVTTELGEKYEDQGVWSPFAKTENRVNTRKAGRYLVIYTLRGKRVARVVTVVDPGDLVLGLKGSKIQIVKQGDPYVENGAFVIDRESGALDGSCISISGGVDTDRTGDYTIRYSAVSGDKKKTAERTVRVVSKNSFRECAGVPVMMYHWIYNSSEPPDRINGNWIEDRALEEHLKYLKDNDYYYPGWKELDAWLDGRIELPEKSIILTFDDGKEAFLKNGKPLFEKYRIPVTSFMICWPDNDPEEKIREYASEYIEFESHSYAMHQAGHVRGHKGMMARMTEEEIAEDLKKAADVVGSNDAFAYPYGDYTPDGQAALRDTGIMLGFTIEYGKAERGMDKTKLPRVRVMSTRTFESWRQSIEP